MAGSNPRDLKKKLTAYFSASYGKITAQIHLLLIGSTRQSQKGVTMYPYSSNSYRQITAFLQLLTLPIHLLILFCKKAMKGR